jgi:hypothetical protein
MGIEKHIHENGKIKSSSGKIILKSAKNNSIVHSNPFLLSIYNEIKPPNVKGGLYEFLRSIS